jgi:ABC-type transporter Mla subunit MlaD
MPQWLGHFKLRVRCRVTFSIALRGAWVKIDQLTDRLNALSKHADETIQNVNGTVSDVREPVRKDVVELQNTLLEAKHLLADMQVIVKANDYKIDDTIENLRTATENLDDLTESVKQRPWSLIRIKQPEDRKVPK